MLFNKTTHANELVVGFVILQYIQYNFLLKNILSAPSGSVFAPGTGVVGGVGFAPSGTGVIGVVGTVSSIREIHS